MIVKIFSTSHLSGKGGISNVIYSYYTALVQAGYSVDLVETHSPIKKLRQINPFIFEIPKLFFSCAIYKFIKNSYYIAYMHAGPGVSLFRKVLLAIICRLFNFPVVFHYHSPAFSKYTSGIRKLLLCFSFKLANKRLVLTPWWQSFFQHNFPKYDFEIIPNPISQNIINAALSNSSIISKDTNIFSVITMARLEKDKGVDDVIEALHHLPNNFFLTIVGDGSHKKQLLKKVSKLGLSHRVTFVGWLNNESKFAALQHADVFCLPSRYDSFGMVFIEAYACGLPVVARYNDAIQSIISNSANNYVWDGCNIDKLAKLIKKATIERHNNVLERKNFVIDNFSPDIIATRINNIFSTL